MTNELFEHLSNCEAQYLSFADVVEYIASIGKYNISDIDSTYKEYMQYCIANDLIQESENEL